MDINKIMRDMENHKAQKSKRNLEAFVNILKEDYRENHEDVNMIYSRDKHKATFKLFKMKSGNFSIIDNSSKETLFSDPDLMEAKIEFILMLSMYDDVTSRIFESASRI